MIDVQRLLVLREVARAGSFTGAAATLRHTPSAVSQQIAALERGTGVELVRRSSRGVTLTDEGRVLVVAGEAIHGELRAAERRLEDLRANGPRTLTVSTFSSAGEPMLAPALTRLAGVRPEVEVTVLEAEPDEALARLRDGGLDLALVYHFHVRRAPPAWSSAGDPLSYTPLLDDPLWLLLPATHDRAAQQTVTPDQVATERWVQGWGDVGAVLDNLASTADFRPLVACRSSDYRFMAALVAAGVGVALVPQLALASADPNVRALPMTPRPVRFVGALQPRRRWPHPAAVLLLDFLATQADALSC